MSKFLTEDGEKEIIGILIRLKNVRLSEMDCEREYFEEIDDNTYEDAKQYALEEFENNFEQHNNFIDDSDFPNEKSYNLAKASIIAYAKDSIDLI